MNYVEEWRAISAKLKSIAEAAQIYARFMQISTNDTYGMTRNLKEQCQEILRDISNFRTTYREALPPSVNKVLDEFLSGNAASTIHLQTEGMREGVIFLITLGARVTYLLANHKETIRAHSERAILHLQRLLAVDSDVRTKWEKAFKTGGELACEKIGAIHLLAHGIMAFKVNTAGARTDLVFNEPPQLTASPRGVDGLVLTEWKLMTASNAMTKFKEAKAQSDLYQQGALLDIELSEYRYLIGVSMDNLPLDAIPNDFNEGGVNYRHINIAINPLAPSKRAVKMAKSK